MSRANRFTPEPRASPERQRLLQDLAGEIRAGQRATDVVDELLCQILRINRTDARCLDILEERGGLTAGELARESRLTTGAITAVIDRLEEAGLARRVRDPEDRRRIRVIPTQDAYELATELMVEPMIAMWRPLRERYTDEQLRLFLEFTRSGREIQERHAEWLRQRLEKRERD
jgi:DNA-binding MarR family transcriptional regulator